MNYKVPFIDYPTHYHRLVDEIDAPIRHVIGSLLIV